MKRLLFFIPLLLLAACASKKPTIVQMPRSAPATILPPDDRQSVRYDENIKAYSVGRYIDPNDGLVMHEAHPIYRVETTAKWNLHPNGPVNIPGGPVVGLIDPAHQNSPLTPEIAAEITRQKAATQALLQQSQRMNEVVSQFSKAIPATLTVAKENDRLQAEVFAAQRRLDLLEEEFRKTPTENTFATSPAPTTKGTNDW